MSFKSPNKFSDKSSDDDIERECPYGRRHSELCPSNDLCLRKLHSKNTVVESSSKYNLISPKGSFTNKIQMKKSNNIIDMTPTGGTSSSASGSRAQQNVSANKLLK